jgi:hypothetical protein
MAAPNLANVVTITAKTDVSNVTTVAANITVNLASSNKVLKINTIYITNVDGTNSGDITATVAKSGVDYKIAHAIAVPAKSSISLITRDTQIYLEEGDYIRVTASANNRLHAICSYEELS